MSISSIHIATGNAGYLSHNDRSLKTNNSIFNDEKNEVSNNAKKAFKIYRNELKIRSKKYTARTKQQLQKKSITHLSAIVNLNQNHTLKDLDPLREYLEDTLGTKVFQISIHRDEGHIEDGKNIKNYHAHLEFMGLDDDGNSVRKKLTRSYLKNLQTKTAEILKMQRGKTNSKAKRLDTYEYKNHKQREEATLKPILATQQDIEKLNKELINKNKELRAELKENKATRKDYAELEQKNKELRAELKEKNLTIDEANILGKKIELLRQNKIKNDNNNNVDNFKHIDYKKIELFPSTEELKTGFLTTQKVKFYDPKEVQNLQNNHHHLLRDFTRLEKMKSTPKVKEVIKIKEVIKEVKVPDPKTYFENNNLKKEKSSLISDLTKNINLNKEKEIEIEDLKKENIYKEQEKHLLNVKLNEKVIEDSTQIKRLKREIKEMEYYIDTSLNKQTNEELKKEIKELKEEIYDLTLSRIPNFFVESELEEAKKTIDKKEQELEKEKEEKENLTKRNKSFIETFKKIAPDAKYENEVIEYVKNLQNKINSQAQELKENLKNKIEAQEITNTNPTMTIEDFTKNIENEKKQQQQQRPYRRPTMRM